MEPPEPAGRAGWLATPADWAAAAALLAASGLAWAWLIAQPEHGSAVPQAMTSAMAPAMAMPSAALAVWTPSYLLAAFAMWVLMMVAMMLPSAAPMILLYRRIAGPRRAAAVTLLFAAAYLAVWSGFSAIAALLQAALVASRLVSGMALAVGDARLAGGLLLLAGAYQLTPLKEACLDACRSPMSFIIRLSRPGWRGAVRLGVAHGLHCLGCCWALMLLLFIGGVMNLAWVAALGLLVLIEKLAPVRLQRLVGAGLIVAGTVLLVGS